MVGNDQWLTHHFRLWSNVVTMVTHTQIEEYSLVSFTPMDISDEQSIGSVLLIIDMTIQYGEDYDVRIPKVY